MFEYHILNAIFSGRNHKILIIWNNNFFKISIHQNNPTELKTDHKHHCFANMQDDVLVQISSSMRYVSVYICNKMLH